MSTYYLTGKQASAEVLRHAANLKALPASNNNPNNTNINTNTNINNNINNNSNHIPLVTSPSNSNIAAPASNQNNDGEISRVHSTSNSRVATSVKHRPRTRQNSTYNLALLPKVLDIYIYIYYSFPKWSYGER